MPVLLTRPAAQSEMVARILAKDGVDCAIWPLTEIVLNCETIEIPAATDGLLFTSGNGVRAFARLSSRRDLPALCVGPATEAAARDAGFADAQSANGDVHALVALTRHSGCKNLLHARGADAAGDLRARLATEEVKVEEAVLYRAAETGPPPEDIAKAIKRGDLTPITVWSPRAGEILARHLDPSKLSQVTLVAISRNAAAPLSGLGWAQIVLAERPNGEAMLAAIRRYFTIQAD